MSMVCLDDLLYRNYEKMLEPIRPMVFPVVIHEKRWKPKAVKHLKTLKHLPISKLIKDNMFNSCEWKLFPNGKLVNWCICYEDNKRELVKFIEIDISSWLNTLSNEEILQLADYAFWTWRRSCNKSNIPLKYKFKNDMSDERVRNTKKWNLFTKKFLK